MDTPYTSVLTFWELNLSPELLKGLYVEMNFEKPSKIQAVSLPMILTPCEDLIAQAHNGFGKTTCFTLEMLSRVDHNNKAPQVLCICPTRIGYSEFGGPLENGKAYWDYFILCDPNGL